MLSQDRDLDCVARTMFLSLFVFLFCVQWKVFSFILTIVNEEPEQQEIIRHHLRRVFDKDFEFD